jgi:hypothetical protein
MKLQISAQLLAAPSNIIMMIAFSHLTNQDFDLYANKFCV